LSTDYQGRGIELAEVSSGYRIQVKRSISDWLNPLWEERAPRYTRALLETLALIAYRQPITRAEIEEVRGVVVSTNIVRTLLERAWIRVVGHRDVPGKPAMFGTTREFLDYFGLKKLEDLPPLAELKDGLPELSPQTDLIESLEAEARGELPATPIDADLMNPFEADAGEGSAQVAVVDDDTLDDDAVEEELSDADAEGVPASANDSDAADSQADDDLQSAEIIPLRASGAEPSESE
jgi:segregation and condensation protein B